MSISMSSSIAAPAAVSSSSFAFSSPAVLKTASGYSSNTSSPSSNHSSPPIHELSFSSYTSISSSAAAALSTVVHSGRLLKRQPLFNWAERFVILTPNEFFWYKRNVQKTPVSLHHSASSLSSSSQSSIPPPSPSPSPLPPLWGEERGHWFVADMAIRFASEKRTFILINTNMSASGHALHANSTENDKEKEKERDTQHEIHLKASNDFDYLAWQHAFQQVIRIQEAKKSKRTGKITESTKNKDNGTESDKVEQKEQELMKQDQQIIGGNGERVRQNPAALFSILPAHHRHNSAPYRPALTPTAIGSTTHFSPLSQPIYTPPPTSSQSRLVPTEISMCEEVKECTGMKQKVLGNGMIEKNSKENEGMLKEEIISVSNALNSSYSSSNRGLPSLYLLSVLLPPSLSASILPGFHSSLFPLLSSSSSSSPSLPIASEFVVYRPLSVSPSSSSDSSSLFSPFSFLIPTFLNSSSSLRFTLTDGSLLHFPLSCLLTDSVIGKSEGEFTVSEAGSQMEILLHWESNSKKKVKPPRNISASLCLCFWLGLLLFASVFYSLSSLPDFAFLSAASASVLLTGLLCSIFLLFTAMQNFLWRGAVPSEAVIITVKAIQMKNTSTVDLTVKRGSGSRKRSKRLTNSSKPKSSKVRSVHAAQLLGSGFVSVAELKRVQKRA